MLAVCLIVSQTMATTLDDIKVKSIANQSMNPLRFNKESVYAFPSLYNHKRMVDIFHSSGQAQELSLDFSSENVIKSIRRNILMDDQSIRLIFDLTRKSRMLAKIWQVAERYYAMLIATNQQQQTVVILAPSTKPTLLATSRPRHGRSPAVAELVLVAIDAGHGGQDPGAISPNGLYEKNVTMAIARKLKTLLDADKMFKSVLTRDGDYFISVMGRSDVARKKGARVLVSIHADAAPNRNARGASVWVLSNQRANSEMATWLEQHEKQSELLGCVGDFLYNRQADPYLSQAVLDLQFVHSQRVGYDIAVKVLSQLQQVGALHKSRPEHASLGVLRSPDIPSLLVEIGFISNPQEARLLGNSSYQDKIANALYLGLRAYFLAHPLQIGPKLENRSRGIISTADTRASVNSVVKWHVVKRGETLSSISRQYGVNMEAIRTLNKLKKDGVWVGQQLRISSKQSIQPELFYGPRHHQVERGDTLTSISLRYGVSTSAIKCANNMTSNTVKLGQMLTIPPG